MLRGGDLARVAAIGMVLSGRQGSLWHVLRRRPIADMEMRARVDYDDDAEEEEDDDEEE